MRVELLTLSGAKWEGEAEELQLTTTNGQLGILPHHEAFVAEVVAGPVTVTENLAPLSASKAGGVVYFQLPAPAMAAPFLNH